jgi:uncharacterized membrane protein
MTRRLSPSNEARAEMIRRAALAFAAAVVLGGCGKAADSSNPAVEAAAPPAPVAPALPAAPIGEPHELRGQALMGKDGYGIVPCGESGQRILEISAEARPFLDKFLERGTHEFFVEAEAQDLAGGRVRVLHFHRLYTEGPGCKAPLESMNFAAFGNEPFWAAVDAGDALRLERPGADALVAKPIESSEVDGALLVKGETGSGTLSLRLTPGFCSDGMSDALYAWNATASFGEQELHGCGFRGSGGKH